MWEHDKSRRNREMRDFDTELVGDHDDQVLKIPRWEDMLGKVGCQNTYTVYGAHGARAAKNN